jgi:hypothetical protein
MKKVQQHENVGYTWCARVYHVHPDHARSGDRPVRQASRGLNRHHRSIFLVSYIFTTVNEPKQNGIHNQSRTHSRRNPSYRLPRPHICFRRGVGKCIRWRGSTITKGGSMFGRRC